MTLVESKPDMAALIVVREPGKAQFEESSRLRAITGTNERG